MTNSRGSILPVYVRAFEKVDEVVMRTEKDSVCGGVSACVFALAPD